MSKNKWINFNKPMFIGMDYDCKFNPLKRLATSIKN